MKIQLTKNYVQNRLSKMYKLNNNSSLVKLKRVFTNLDKIYQTHVQR